MPVAGACADCGRICHQQAWDGKFYCDPCWATWEHSSARDKQQWANTADVVRQQREEATRAAKAREVAIVEAHRAAKQRELQLAKEREYWEARRLLEEAKPFENCETTKPIHLSELSNSPLNPNASATASAASALLGDGDGDGEEPQDCPLGAGRAGVARSNSSSMLAGAMPAASPWPPLRGPYPLSTSADSMTRPAAAVPPTAAVPSPSAKSPATTTAARPLPPTTTAVGSASLSPFVASAEPPGASGEAERLAPSKTQVVFWGICDLKYDPTRSKAERVKVLELGDGRSSRFSHHGAIVKQRFHERYCLDGNPLRRGVMVDNKKLTHDTFVSCGLAHLRPRQFAYAKRYERDLAERIRGDLGLREGQSVVLKLVNRARGAGVVVCPESKLDDVLKRLLSPPVGSAFSEWLAQHAPTALDEVRSEEVLGEQQLHYWSNECPLFVVEELVHSAPVAMEDHKCHHHQDHGNHQATIGNPNTAGCKTASTSEVFDGTMRVGFVLRRKDNDSVQLEVEWLGGYWKLPPSQTTSSTSAPASASASASAETSDAGTTSLEEARARIVSSFNTEEKRTAVVQAAQLEEVYTALTPAIPRLFEVQNLSIRELSSSYQNDLNFRAFAMTRCAAAMRVNNNVRNCTHTLRQAKTFVKLPPRGENDLPERAVLSYIHRSIGVNYAMLLDWVQALKCQKEALQLLPTNASAHYLKGIVLQELGKWEEAVDCHLSAFALDPDFRSPLMSLGECWTRLGKYEEAIKASRLCLRLQPDAPVAQFNMGQAMYQQFRAKQFPGLSGSEAFQERRAKARHCFEVARAAFPRIWTDDEAAMLRYFEEEPPLCDELPLQNVRSWKAYGWRP